MKTQLITAFVLTLAAGPSLAHAQASAETSCPAGWDRDSVESSRCLRVDPLPALRWLAVNDGELYTADAEFRCVAPDGGRCAEEIGGHRAPLVTGIVLLSTGYALSIATTILVDAFDHLAPAGAEVALNLIPLVGPSIAIAAAYDSNANGLPQLLIGLLSSVLQLGGTVFTLLGALLPRTVSRDADGEEVRLAEAGELRWIGPTGFALAF